MPVLAALRLHDADDHLRTVDVARPQPHHLAGPQTAAIGDGQHHPRLQARRHGENTLDLLTAQHRRQLLRLLEVPYLGRQIVATQRDAEQEPHPGHDPIAVTDACTAPGASSAAARAAISAATAATPSSASPRHAPSSKSHSGIILATDWPSQAQKPFPTCQKSSSPEPNRPDRHDFCPYYGNRP